MALTSKQHSEQLAYLTTMGIPLWAPQSQELVSTHTRQNLDNSEATDSLSWSELQAQVETCAACELHKTRTNVVFGVGNQQADLLIIGEAPGADEDKQGEPFVGRAGQLLNAMLQSIGFARHSVYIANILKCRPPNNRDPKPEEAEQCAGYLYQQIRLLQPKVIVAVGRIAAQRLLKTDTALGKLRGRVHQLPETQTPFIVTYHPAYLLRSPLDKRKAWEDLLFVKQTLTEMSL